MDIMHATTLCVLQIWRWVMRGFTCDTKYYRDDTKGSQAIIGLTVLVESTLLKGIAGIHRLR